MKEKTRQSRLRSSRNGRMLSTISYLIASLFFTAILIISLLDGTSLSYRLIILGIVCTCYLIAWIEFAEYKIADAKWRDSLGSQIDNNQTNQEKI